MRLPDTLYQQFEHPNAGTLPQTIPQSVMLAVLNRCDDTREFMIEMWKANPKLGRQGGAKVTMLLSSSIDSAEILDDVTQNT